MIDPFYSNIVEEKQGLKRLMQPPVSLEALRPDLIFITHNHVDHFDPVTLPKIHKLYPMAPVIGPQSVLKKGEEYGFDFEVLHLFKAGAQHKAKHLNLYGISTQHGDPYALGCLIETEENLVYYSGDTEYFDDLHQEIISTASAIGRPVNLVFIIINGKLGNMNVKEAIELTAQLSPRLAIPMHYGMFAENTEDPALFINGCRKKNINAIELQPGQTTIL